MHLRALTGTAGRALKVLFISTFAGCNRAADTGAHAGDWSGTVRDSAGVRIISNPESGIWTDTTRWSLSQDLTIGARDSAREYEFGRIADIDAGPDGRIYVLDNQTAKVSQFDDEGRYILSFGKLGRGPGEFSIEASAVVVELQGRLFVRDRINRRDNVFSLDGRFLQAVPVDATFREWAAVEQGKRAQRSTGATWDGLVRVDSAGHVIDTIAAFKYDVAATRGALSRPAGNGPGDRTVIPLLRPFPMWSVTSEGRVLTGISTRYRVEVRRPDGKLDMLIEKQHDPLALRASDRDQLNDRMRLLMHNAGLSEEQIAEAFQRFSYLPPDSMPAIAGLAGGPAGTIWVQGVLPVGSMTGNATLDALNPGSAVWDVFCPNGLYLGQLRFPPKFELKRIRGFHLYGVEADDLDVQRVVRLRTVAPSGDVRLPPSCEAMLSARLSLNHDG